MEMLLLDKVAIVTGGASGLGRATCELFAQHGASVVVADLNDARGADVCDAIKAAGGRAAYRRTDVRLAEDVKGVVQFAEDTFGKLNIMVANAGIGGMAVTKKLEELDEEDWLQIHDVNLNGVWRCFKFAAPAIRRAGGGSMTATSSLAGVQTLGGTLLGAYTSTKAAVCALSSFFATELTQDHIRVNTVCPGGMLTNFGESTPGLTEIWEEIVAKTELKAIGEALYPICDPIEVARAHLFLNSELASFVNGQTLLADGGGSLNAGGLLLATADVASRSHFLATPPDVLQEIQS